MRNFLFVAVVVLAGCGGKKKAAEAPKADCAAAIDNAMNLSKDDYKKSNIADAAIPKIREVSLQRCTEDKWSDQVLACFVAAKSATDLTSCHKMMTKEQFENLGKAVTALMQPQGSDSGSDSGSAGSAAEGSGSAGSAAGSATGSGSAAGAGSAAGSGSAK